MNMTKSGGYSMMVMMTRNMMVRSTTQKSMQISSLLIRGASSLRNIQSSEHAVPHATAAAARLASAFEATMPAWRF